MSNQNSYAEVLQGFLYMFSWMLTREKNRENPQKPATKPKFWKKLINAGFFQKIFEKTNKNRE